MPGGSLDDHDLVRRNRTDFGVRIVREVVVVVAVAVTEDHPRVEESLEGLLRVHETEVVEHFVPEAAVEQVEYGVLGAPDVQVHRHPVAFGLGRPGRLLVGGIDESQVVPAAPGPLRHGVDVAAGGLPGFGIRGLDPRGDPAERWLEFAARFEIVEFGKQNGEIFFGNEPRLVALEVQHRQGLSPVALPAEEPIA